MSQTGFTPILTYASNTATNVPSASNLTNSSNGSELAVNTEDKRLFTKNSAGSVVEIGTNPSTLSLPNSTANGVLYLNGSKVATSGSALVFDGTNLGVGTSSPNAKLAVQGGNFALQSSTTSGNTSVGYISGYSDRFGSNYETGRIDFQTGGFADAGQILFYTKAGAGSLTERLRIDSSGNVGIGTSSPSSKIEVNGLMTTTSGGSLTPGSANGLHFGFASNIGYIASFHAGVDWRSLYLNAKDYRFYTNDNERMRLDSSGNLGLGVTPSAWLSGYKAFQNGNASILSRINADDSYWNGNTFYDTAWKYIYNGYAHRYEMFAGQHRWFTAPSGTAGAAATFTQAMTLDASGNLGIGTSSPSSFSGYTTVSVNNATNGGIYNILVNGTETARLQAYGGVFNVAAKGASTVLLFETNGSERMRLDPSGNLGLGVTPSAWGAGRRAFQVAGSQANYFMGGNANATVFGVNTFHDGNNNIYIANGFANLYLQGSGQHIWYTAPSGTAGDPIPFTQAMTLDASGNLGVGTTSPSSKIEVNGLMTTTSGGSLTPGSANGLHFGFASNIGYIASFHAGVDWRSLYLNAKDYRFYTNDNERMRIHASGGVSIGNTTDPGAGNLSVTGNISASGQLDGGYNDTTGSANTAAQALGTNTVSMVLISANTTLTSTVPPAGAHASVIIKTSGNASRTVTFGTGFKAVGTLATGNTADRYWVVNFVSDGTFLYEASRTTAAYA